MTWTFANTWNLSLEDGSVQRPLEKREKIWASELGGSFIDRYLKMNAVPPTNPPNARSRRKFEAGNIWESILAYILKRADLLKEQQTWLGFQYPALLPVSGKLDFLAGGKPDYNRAKKVIETEFNWLPEFISRAMQSTIAILQEEHPDGLEDIVFEIKSCSGFMFDIYERNNDASGNHKLQLFHYLKAGNYPEGHIVYVSKDDARLLEIGVLNPSVVEVPYKADIEKMSYFVQNKTEPPKEEPVVFDAEFQKFSANWKIGYSQYLTKLYGLKNQMEFDNRYKPIVERWNRVLGRIKQNKPMTENNKQALEEMKADGFEYAGVKDGQIIIVKENEKWD